MKRGRRVKRLPPRPQRTITIPPGVPEVIEARTADHIEDMVCYGRSLQWLAQTCYIQAMVDVNQVAEDLPERWIAIAATRRKDER
jgi:hypothetical protein